MTILSVSALFTSTTAAQWYAVGLEVAKIVGLPVDSWRAGDPTRTTYKYIARALEALDGVIGEYARSTALSSAEGEWLKVLAWEVYGVEALEKNYATPTVSVTNSGGGFYDLAPGEVIFKNSATGKTYRNTNTVTLAGGASGVFETVADEAGSDSSTGANEIDEFVAPALLGVTITGSSSAAARDDQSEESIREQCRSTLGALSPNGPPDAYEFVARNPDLTGITEVTRARTIADDPTGDVTLYIAGASGAVSGGAVTAVQNAIMKWATPLTVTPTAVSASAVVVGVDYTVEGDEIPDGWEDLVEGKLGVHFAGLDISDGTDLLARSAIIQQIHNASSTIKRVTLISPATDTALGEGEVAVPGVITGTEV